MAADLDRADDVGAPAPGACLCITQLPCLSFYGGGITTPQQPFVPKHLSPTLFILYEQFLAPWRRARPFKQIWTSTM